MIRKPWKNVFALQTMGFQKVFDVDDFFVFFDGPCHVCPGSFYFCLAEFIDDGLELRVIFDKPLNLYVEHFPTRLKIFSVKLEIPQK